MTPPNLTELAERVERLTGPCRETDVAIWAAITPADTWRRIEPGKSYSTWQIRDSAKGEWRDYYPGLNAKLYTASLDAAMTLATDEAFILEINQQPSGWVVKIAHKIDDSQQWEAEGPTFPGTLSAAWLRARASMEAHRDQN